MNTKLTKSMQMSRNYYGLQFCCRQNCGHTMIHVVGCSMIRPGVTQPAYDAFTSELGIHSAIPRTPPPPPHPTLPRGGVVKMRSCNRFSTGAPTPKRPRRRKGAGAKAQEVCYRCGEEGGATTLVSGTRINEERNTQHKTGQFILN